MTNTKMPETFQESLLSFTKGSDFYEKQFGKHTFANGFVTDTFVRIDKRRLDSNAQYYNRYHLTVTKNIKTKGVIFRTHYFRKTRVDKNGATIEFSEPVICDGVGIEFSEKMTKEIVRFIQG